MNKLLTAYCIEFGETLAMQYGVSAYSFDDAISLLKHKVFQKDEMPNAKKIIEGIKSEDLDQNHIIPNMGVITERGIWFPNLLNY